MRDVAIRHVPIRDVRDDRAAPTVRGAARDPTDDSPRRQPPTTAPDDSPPPADDEDQPALSEAASPSVSGRGWRSRCPNPSDVTRYRLVDEQLHAL